MRLPMNGASINVPESIRLMRHAMDQGVNYLDTAYVYHGGLSEGIVGQAVKDGYRDRVFLATKSPLRLIQEAGDFDRILEEQLVRLDTDWVDFYLLHAFNRDSWEKCKRLDVFGFLERAKKSGKIRHAGFSFHDSLPVFMDIVDHGGWDFCQIQYNFLDRAFQAGEAGLTYAKDAEIDVVVMEPLRGGSLARSIPPAVQALWNTAALKRTPAQWALRWVWNNPGVSVVLSGMQAMDQVYENLETASDAGPNALSIAELELIDQVEATYRSLEQISCTGCRYCMPCPAGVNIAQNFLRYNNLFMFMQDQAVKNSYRMMPEAERAKNCIQCGACEALCPQQLPIRENLKAVATAFAGV